MNITGNPAVTLGNKDSVVRISKQTVYVIPCIIERVVISHHLSVNALNRFRICNITFSYQYHKNTPFYYAELLNEPQITLQDQRSCHRIYILAVLLRLFPVGGEDIMGLHRGAALVPEDHLHPGLFLQHGSKFPV